MDQPAQESSPNLTALAGDIVSAYVSRNSLPAAEVPALLIDVYNTLAGFGGRAVPEEPAVENATPVQAGKAITPDRLSGAVESEPDGSHKRYPSLLGLTIEQFRERYGLPVD